MVALVYRIPLYFAETQYKNNSQIKNFGLLLGFSVMFFAEFVGHTFFEGKQSRLEAVPNAIIYSHYFAVGGTWV